MGEAHGIAEATLYEAAGAWPQDSEGFELADVQSSRNRRSDAMWVDILEKAREPVRFSGCRRGWLEPRESHKRKQNRGCKRGTILGIMSVNLDRGVHNRRCIRKMDKKRCTYERDVQIAE